MSDIRANIRDVAKLAGVAVKTVSIAAPNGQPPVFYRTDSIHAPLFSKFAS